MFALEIEFSDAGIERELVLIRRPLAVIGPQDTAHVVVDDMRVVKEQILLCRHIGRRFRVAGLTTQIEHVLEDELSFQEFEGEAVLVVGPVKLRVIALDSDFALRAGEPPDRAGVRILREAMGVSHPLFPALVVKAGVTIVYSFAPEVSVTIGRSRECLVRVDLSIVSSNHARIGFEKGRFWAEDLGSTNGTFKNGVQITGRTPIEAGERIVLGRDLSITGVLTADQILRAAKQSDKAVEGAASYPILTSLSDSVRPARITLVPGLPIHIGRDPSSEMWIGAPHVSRRHAVVELHEEGRVSITNHSVNGTSYGEGTLAQGKSISSEGRPYVLDFGSGITVGLCFSETNETTFTEMKGATSAFRGRKTKGGRSRNTMNLTKAEVETIRSLGSPTRSADDIDEVLLDSITLHGDVPVLEVKDEQESEDLSKRLRGLFGKRPNKP